MLELNRLQSSITQRMINHVMEFDSQTIWVSLGSILGGPIFSGRGPSIEIKLIPANFIQTKIANKFTSAGINQTRHQVVMDINLTVTAVLPGYRSSTTIDTNVVLAETVIVGNVPEAYTMVGDGTDSLVGMIQDYGASVPSK
ncbi:MAG: sporulation protein YunB [Angelakisella sp.]